MNESWQRPHPSGPHGRVIAVWNKKGGTNKTTTAVSLATVAAGYGTRVLAVDGDDQGTLTKWLGHRPGRGLYEAINDGTSFEDIVVPTRVEGLELIPASTELSDADARLGGVPGIQQALRDGISACRPRDLVLIDSPGDVQLMSLMALVAAGEVVVPIPPEAPAYAELPGTMEFIETVQRRVNQSLTVLGVVATSVATYFGGARLDGEARKILVDMREQLGDVVLNEVVRQSAKFGGAFDAGIPISWYDEGGTGDTDYRAVALRLGLTPSVVEAAS